MIQRFVMGILILMVHTIVHAQSAEENAREHLITVHAQFQQETERKLTSLWEEYEYLLGNLDSLKQSRLQKQSNQRSLKAHYKDMEWELDFALKRIERAQQRMCEAAGLAYRTKQLFKLKKYEDVRDNLKQSLKLLMLSAADCGDADHRLRKAEKFYFVSAQLYKELARKERQ